MRREDDRGLGSGHERSRKIAGVREVVHAEVEPEDEILLLEALTVKELGNGYLRFWSVSGGIRRSLAAGILLVRSIATSGVVARHL